VLRSDQLHQPRLVEQAYGRQAAALLRQLDAACRSAEELADATVSAFAEHPDARIVTSLPGLGPLTGARILAEIGDDRTRFTDARALKAFAGSAPVTRASGKTVHVMHRRVKNQRLASVGYLWAFAALSASPGARTHYDRRRATGERHIAAQRNLFNRLIGILYHCLQDAQPYSETSRSQPPNPEPTNPPLDQLAAWDVSICSVVVDNTAASAYLKRVGSGGRAPSN
jgi:transposase